VPIDEAWTKRKYSKAQILKAIDSGYNLGWCLGPTDIVIDVDPRNGGLKSLRKIEKKYGKLKKIAPTVKTGSGGYHFYFTKPQPEKLKAHHKKLPGIDFKQFGGQVVIPGSVHPDTQKPYKLSKKSPYGKSPQLLKKLHKMLQYNINGSASSAPAGTITPDSLKVMLDTLDVYEFGSNALWQPIMAAAHDGTDGAGLDVFLEWSLGDNRYADHEQVIRSRWNSLEKKPGNITIAYLCGLTGISTNELNESKADVQKDFEAIIPDRIVLKDLDVRLSYEILDEHYCSGDHLVFSADQNFWVFDTTHWRKINQSVIENQALEIIKQHKANNKKETKGAISYILSQVMKVLKAEVSRDINLFDPKFGLSSVINTKNYEIWVQPNGEIELTDHQPKSYLTKCLGVEYDPKATCPEFDTTIAEIFKTHPDRADTIEHLWELIGYTLQPIKNIAIWVLFHGGGSNGKSTILKVIAALLDDFVLEKAIADISTAKNNHALAELPGKLALIDDDLASRIVLPDSAIKKLSENKMLSANPKGLPEYKFKNTAICYIAANSWPQTQDLSKGLSRRALVFEFNNTFDPKTMDHDLPKRIIENELPGVLNKALEGYKRLRKRGHFNQSKSCKKAVKTWFKNSNQMLQFLSECYRRKEKSIIVFNTLWDNYTLWIEQQGIKRAYSKRGLELSLRDNGFKFRRKDNELKLIGLETKVDLRTGDFD
jgi:P4 family phage/plasmid primase-like protien